jgi:hypothetical protein
MRAILPAAVAAGKDLRASVKPDVTLAVKRRSRLSWAKGAT